MSTFQSFDLMALYYFISSPWFLGIIATILVIILCYQNRSRLLKTLVTLIDYIVSFKKYVGSLVSDLFVTGAIFYSGYSAFKYLHSNEFGLMSVVTTIFVVAVKLKRYRRFSMGSESEIAVVNENRAELGASLRRFNDLRPAVHYGQIQISEQKLVKTILQDQLKLLDKRLRLGFGIGPSEKFTASLLFYKPKDQSWHKWGTVDKSGDISGHRTGNWPMTNADFKLSQNLYTRPYRDRHYETHDIKGDGYHSVLSIPFYFPSSAKNQRYSPGDIYAVLSYTTNKAGYFSKLDELNFITFFLLESSIIERAAYRLLRSYYDK